MKPTWALAGYPIPDPGVWPGPVRAAAAAVVFAGVAAAIAAWAALSTHTEQPRLPALEVNPQGPTAGAAPAPPSGAAPAGAGPSPVPTRVVPEPWTAPLQAGLELGLKLDWLRPKGAPRGEVHSGAVMSVRILGRYRELAMWLETLQHLHEPITVQGLTLRSVDGPTPENPSDIAGEPLLSLEATLMAGHAPAHDHDRDPTRQWVRDSVHDSVHDAIRDPFQHPLRVWAGSKARPRERAARLGLSPNPARASSGPDLVSGHLGDPQWLGQLGRAGEAWTLLQVGGRVQAARNGAVLGPMQSQRQPLMEDAP